MCLRHLILMILVKLNLWYFFDKMQTFLTETFFADIAIIHDIEVEGIQVIVQMFHYKIHFTIIGSIDNAVLLLCTLVESSRWMFWGWGFV